MQHSTPQHIGIVACSAEGAALCYRSICNAAAQRMGPHQHPEITLHSLPLADYVDCLEQHDLAGVAELMLHSARKLASVGADFLICPDNTIHQAMPWVLAQSPLPWLHIAEVVAEHAVRLGARCLGLTGTQWLVESEVYPEALAKHGLTYLRPTRQQAQEINRIIMEELVYGEFKPNSIAYFQQLIEQFKTQGCDAVILGCTEIPLIINNGNAALPCLDSTRLLAHAALNRSLGRNEPT